MSSGATTVPATLQGPSPVEGRPDYARWVLSGTVFELPAHYRLLKSVGTGAYGIVAAAEDTRTVSIFGGAPRRVAIKKVPSAFNDLSDTLRILREIRLLRHFAHENIVSLLDLPPPAAATRAGGCELEDVYLVTPLMETDLHRIIHSRQALSDDHIQFFVYQVLLALRYVHSAHVIHRDLKPSNILLNADCTLKICDFGLSRGVVDEASDLTEYVVTRWYRAPEVMLSVQEYGPAIDVWGLGCILGELLGSTPLFPGADYLDQLRLIIDVLGSPSDADMAFVKSPRARAFLAKHSGKARTPFATLFPRANPAALDLLERLLAFSPGARISVADALRHPYMASLHSEDPRDEPTCGTTFEPEKPPQPLAKADLQARLWREIAAFHPELGPPPPPPPPPPPQGGVGDGGTAAGGGAAAAGGAMSDAK